MTAVTNGRQGRVFILTSSLHPTSSTQLTHTICTRIYVYCTRVQNVKHLREVHGVTVAMLRNITETVFWSFILSLWQLEALHY
jgi:hypothetical protein